MKQNVINKLNQLINSILLTNDCLLLEPYADSAVVSSDCTDVRIRCALGFYVEPSYDL